MGVFHVFKIVQMVPNRATHHLLVISSVKECEIHNDLFLFPVNLSCTNTIILDYFRIKKFMRIHFNSAFDLWMATIDYLKEII